MHHMPTNYHQNGGGLCKYTEHEWLLYTLGGVEIIPHANLLCMVHIANDVKCNFHTTVGEISTSVFTVQIDISCMCDNLSSV